jgi:xanthine dehydrogenase YagR molybdenum-binding subunit
MTEGYVGQRKDRVEGRLKVTGGVKFSAEVAVANVAHVAVVQSSIARGRIKAWDVQAALNLPGVLAVITPENAPKLPAATKRGTSPLDRVLQLLQDDKVLYNGQPIALVVADTLERAQAAGLHVGVTYDEARPSVVLEESSSTEEPPENPTSPTFKPRGDFEKAFSDAPVKVDATYTTPRENHNPMEPHATIAVWHGDRELTLYDSTQSIFGVRKRIAALFELEPANVRVICHYVGGGFGCKGAMWSHVALAALAAKVVGRPAKLAVTRPQMFVWCGYRPDTIQKVALGAQRDGRLVAIRHETLSQTSRFDDFTEPSSRQTRMLYACPNVTTSQRLLRLDVSTPTFMRAPGESSGTFALESAMDELAYALGMDPIELRLKNDAEKDPEDGKAWSSKSLRECYARGREHFGWARRNPRPRSMRDGRILVGMGMATATYPARQDTASATARLTPDGRAVVLAGSQDLGTGTYTVMTQIAADALGLPMDRIHFDLGDTDFPEAPGSGGSRTAATVGPAVKMASDAVRDRVIALAVADAASPLHGLDPKEVEARDGKLTSTRDPSKVDTHGAVLGRNHVPAVEEKATSKPVAGQKERSCHSFGAQFVEVGVDPDLGEVRVRRAVGAFAAGRLLNAKTAHSQFMGGMIFGIGMALEEKTVIDARTGRVVTKDLSDYHVPVNADVPVIDVVTVEEEDLHVNPIGVKGIGEIGITGMAAAIANAVFHATGKRVRDLPITLDKLLDA